MSQKSYDGKPALYLIPTPIGNLDDITLRAIKTLEEVEVIFSEDTRVTGLLLQHLNIKKKMYSANQHKEDIMSSKMLQYLSDGYSVGYVSDRGTPVISDPGNILVKKAIEHGYYVIGLPGPTALIPAIITSGISSDRFLFVGFLDHKDSKRKKQLEDLKLEKVTLVLYESPHRIVSTLQYIWEILGDREISISREISKKYEEIYRGTTKEIFDYFLNLETVKGEFVIVLQGNLDVNSYDELTITSHVNLYVEDGMPPKEAIKVVAKERGMKKSDVYEEYHKMK